MSYDFEVAGEDGFISEVENNWGLPEDVTATITNFIAGGIGADGQASVEEFAGGENVTVPEDIEVARLSGGGSYTVTGDPVLVHVDTDEAVTIDVAPGGSVIVLGGTGDDAISFVSPGAEMESMALTDGEGSEATVLLDGGAGDDEIVGGDMGETLMGGAGDDTLMGGAGDDTLDGGPGDDLIDGGAGFDEIVVSGGAREDYTVAVEDGSIVLTDASGDDTATISGGEYVSFEEGGAIIGVATLEQGDIARLYELAFDREADAAGLQFWLKVADSGASFSTIADFFAGSEEFQARIGDGTARQIVEVIYEDGYEREGDEAGVDFWTNVLESGAFTTGDLLVAFATSDEARDDLFGYITRIDDFDLG